MPQNHFIDLSIDFHVSSLSIKCCPKQARSYGVQGPLDLKDTCSSPCSFAALEYKSFLLPDQPPEDLEATEALTQPKETATMEMRANKLTSMS